MEDVKVGESFDDIHFLPHKAIRQNGKNITKVCVVFDGFARLPEKPSLYDILYSGPCLLP